MIKWLIDIFWGSNCKHGWKELKRNEYPDCTKILYTCTHCGKFIKKSI